MTPHWAHWHVPAKPAVPWASIRYRTGNGLRPGLILACSRGWVSLRVQTPAGDRCEVWPPERIQWQDAELLPGCTGVRVTLPDGKVHEVGAEDAARLWAWVRRGVEVGAVVEGLVVESG